MHTEETGISREHAAAEKMIGKVIDGRFRIDTLVGSGAMGNVFRATHLQMDAVRALKVLHPWLMMDARSCKRFLQEARAISSLDHPNVVKVYACGQSDDIVYIAMDFLQGESLADVIKEEPKFSIERATDLIIHAARGLAHAHEKLVVHRDVKPSNIMLCDVDGSVVVKVVDFGVAKILESDATTSGQNLTGTGAAIGTPYYMSPEQCANIPIDARSDIYSLGCVLYQLVCGRLPVEGDSVFAAMYSHIQGEIIPIGADVPAWMREIILKCLAKDRENRFQSMGELIGALEARTAGNTKGSATAKRRQRISAAHMKLWAACIFVAGTVVSALVALHLHPEWTGVKAQELQSVRGDIERLQHLVAHTEHKYTPHEYWRYRHELLTLKAKELALTRPDDMGDSARRLLGEYFDLAKIREGGHEVSLLYEAAKLPGLSQTDRVNTLVTALQSVAPDGKGESANVRSYNRRILDSMKSADLSLLPQTHNPTLYGRLSQIVQAFLRIAKYADAEDALGLWLQLARNNANETIFHAQGLAFLARVKGLTGREQEALADEKQALRMVEDKTSIGRSLPPEHQLAASSIYSLIGHRELERKEYDSAFVHHSKAATVPGSGRTQTRHPRSDGFLYAGVALHSQGNLNGALDQYNRALAVWDEASEDDPERASKTAQLKRLIGDSYAVQQQPKNALDAYRASETYAVHARNLEKRDYYRFTSIIGQTIMLRQLGRLAEAERTLERAASIEMTFAMQADFKEQKGNSCFLRRDFATAARYFSEEVAARKQAGAPAAAMCMASLRASDTYLAANNTVQANRCRDDALKYAKLSGDKKWIDEAEKRFKQL